MLGWFKADADRASFSKRFMRDASEDHLRRQHLDRHLATQPLVFGPVDLPHPS